jgi:hypothetical protein
LSAEILERVEQVTVLMLLPVFFITTGLNVDVNSLGKRGFVELAAVLAVACVGKFVGATAAARGFGVPMRRAAAVGVLMNTRGLTELVILNIGYDTGVLDRELFTVLVLMAVITTVMTSPLLRRIYTDRMIARDIALAERAALGLSADYRVVAVVGGAHDEAVVDAGVMLLRGEPSTELVISRFDPPFQTVEVGSGLTSELAGIAASFETMQALARRAGERGAAVVVRSQFSEDVVRDLGAQLLAADADVVLVDSADAMVVSGILSVAECAVVVRQDGGAEGTTVTSHELPSPDAEPAVVVLVSGGDDGLAAVEQGCRIASDAGLSLRLVERTDRRAHRRADALRRRLVGAHVPFDVSVDTSAPARGDAVALVGWAEWQSLAAADRAAFDGFGSILFVRAAVEDRGDRLNRLLERLQTESEGMASATDGSA